MHPIRCVLAARNADADGRRGRRGHHRSRASDPLRPTRGVHCIRFGLHVPGWWLAEARATPSLRLSEWR